MQTEWVDKVHVKCQLTLINRPIKHSRICHSQAVALTNSTIRCSSNSRTTVRFTSPRLTLASHVASSRTTTSRGLSTSHKAQTTLQINRAKVPANRQSPVQQHRQITQTASTSRRSATVYNYLRTLTSIRLRLVKAATSQ